MAPVAPNQKRRRGRLPATAPGDGDAPQRATGASEAEQGDATTHENQRDSDAREETRPKKRGRPRKSVTNIAVIGQAAPDPKPASPVRRSKRDRRSIDDNPYWLSGSKAAPEQQDNEADSVAPPKKKQRPLHSKAPVEEEQPGQDNAQQKRRGRPRVSIQEPEELASRETNTQPGRRTKGTKPPARTKPPPSKRPSTAIVVGKRKDSGPSQQPGEPNTARPAGRQSVADGTTIAQLDEELSASLPSASKFRHIEPRTRQVPRSVIADKWVPLDEASINTISTILSDTSRLVLLQLRDREERYQQGHKILQVFSSRLRRKLLKGLPFPPPTTKPASRKSEGISHAAELDFENTVESIDALERALNPLLDSIKLLEKEKAKEEAALKTDYKNLTSLEANAKAEARGWKERGRRTHPLVPTGLDEESYRGEANRLKLAKARGDAVPNRVFQDIHDDEVATMSQQIANHMESMRGNLQPIQDIIPAMGQSRAALQTVLQKHLAATRLERVLLG